MQIVPLQAVPSQLVNVTLNGQASTIEVQQKSTGLFITLSVNDALIISEVIAENANVIVRSVYLGFIGDVAFLDTQGTTDPVYTGLGDRYVLAYFAPSELPLGLA
jgi:hypothetical protein